MKALLVDDDIPTLEVIRSSIDWYAFQITVVFTAFNISEAKTIIENDAPDIIICDIEMPKGSGLDLLKWARENGIGSEFIFLTCHESFEFAATAISYNAASYITKPFSREKTEAAIAKAVNSIARQNYLQEYSTYGKYWIDSRFVVEQGFWKDVLLGNIPPKAELIRAELQKRHLPQDIMQDYYIILSCVNKSQIDNVLWDDDTFKYAFGKLASEILMEEPELVCVFSYMRSDAFYNAAIVNCNNTVDDIRIKCHNLIQACKDYLHCIATCYIGKRSNIENMANALAELEDIDRNNILNRGTAVFQEDFPKNADNEQYSLNAEFFTGLLVSGEKVRIATALKSELEYLASKKALDTVTLHSIRQDLMQIVYSALNENGIQAHRLFSDKLSQKLFQASENNVFDMMKWATFLIDKTVDYLQEAKKSEGVVEKAKRFIHQNYSRNITREDIASYVFLAPDYLSKIFKSETGVHIKDYLNEVRIEKAKKLLAQSDLSISEIASDTGFESFSYFSTVFKKITGQSPYAFRKSHKE